MKPKNDGQMLQVRISRKAHADLGRVLLHMAECGVPAALRTKAGAIEMALDWWTKTYSSPEAVPQVQEVSK